MLLLYFLPDWIALSSPPPQKSLIWALPVIAWFSKLPTAILLSALPWASYFFVAKSLFIFYILLFHFIVRRPGEVKKSLSKRQQPLRLRGQFCDGCSCRWAWHNTYACRCLAWTSIFSWGSGAWPHLHRLQPCSCLAMDHFDLDPSPSADVLVWLGLLNSACPALRAWGCGTALVHSWSPDPWCHARLAIPCSS